MKLVTEILGGPQAETVREVYSTGCVTTGAKRLPCRLRQETERQTARFEVQDQLRLVKQK